MLFRGGNSSSDLSSPNETCYSFVRRAIERISTPVHRQYDEPDDSEGGSSSTMETRFPWLGLAKLEKFAIHTVRINIFKHQIEIWTVWGLKREFSLFFNFRFVERFPRRKYSKRWKL